MATTLEIAGRNLFGFALALLISTAGAHANATGVSAEGKDALAPTASAGNTWYVDGTNGNNHNNCMSRMGDLNNTDPKLGRPKNNGGPTATMALLKGSPAIDSGNPAGCTDGRGHLLTTDQRDMPRPDKEDSGACDRGAFERQSN